MYGFERCAATIWKSANTASTAMKDFDDNAMSDNVVCRSELTLEPESTTHNDDESVNHGVIS